MVDGLAPNDKYLKALDFIIKFMQIHEKNFDQLVDRLEKCNVQILELKRLKIEIDCVEEEVTKLEEQLLILRNCFLSRNNRFFVSSAFEKKPT